MFKIVGITDEVTSCECCGKSNLKKTVALMDDNGNVTYFGQTCASKAAGWTKEYVKEEVKQIDKTNKQLMKEKREEIEIWVRRHPLKKEIRDDQSSLSGVPFAKRKELGFIKKWNEMEQQIKNEIFKIFTDEISLMLFKHEQKQYGKFLITI